MNLFNECRHGSEWQEMYSIYKIFKFKYTEYILGENYVLKFNKTFLTQVSHILLFVLHLNLNNHLNCKQMKSRESEDMSLM